MRQQTLQVKLQAIDNMSKPLLKMQKAMSLFANKSQVQVAKLERGLRSVSNSVNNLFGGFGGLGAGFLAYKVADEIMEFETNLIGVAKTAGLTEKQTASLGKAYVRLSKEMKTVSARELASYGAVGGQMGLNTEEDLLRFSKIFAMLERSAPSIEGEEGALMFMRAMALNKAPIEEMENYASAIVYAGNTTKAAEAEILALYMAIGRSSGLYKFTAQETVAAASIMAALGESAEAGGSAIGKTLRTINSAVTAGGDSLRFFAQSAGMSSSEFLESWKENKFKSFMALLTNLGEMDKAGIDTSVILDQLDLKTLRVFRTNATMSQQYAELGEKLKNVNIEYDKGTALQEEFHKSQKTLRQTLEYVKNSFVNYYIEIMQTKNSFSKLRTVLVFVAENIGKLLTVGGRLLMLWLAMKGTLLVLKTIMFANNVAIGINTVLTQANKKALIGNNVARVSYIFVTNAMKFAQLSANIVIGSFSILIKLVTGQIGLASAATALWTGIMKVFAIVSAAAGGAVGLITIAIFALILGLIAVVYYWDEWGAKLVETTGYMIPIVGTLMSIYKHWEMITESFSKGGILEGIKALKLALLDSLITPLITAVELFDKMSGTNYAQSLIDYRSKAFMDSGLVKGDINTPFTEAEFNKQNKANQDVLTVDFRNMPKGVEVDHENTNGVQLAETM